MAGPVFVKIRLWNPGRDCIFGDTSHVLPNYLEKPYLNTGANRRFFEIFWKGATQVAAEEFGTAAASVLNGTTTPLQLFIDCAQNNDRDITAGDARKIAVIGVTVSSVGNFNAGEKPKLTVEVINLNGTTGVNSIRWYLWVIHGYICDWGSAAGADALGNVTIESPATTVGMTVAATFNESDSGILYFAAGDKVRLDLLRITPVTYTANDGCLVTITESGFDHTLNTDADLAVDNFNHICGYTEDATYRDAWIVPKLATIQSSLKFAETLVTTTQTYKIHATILVNK